MKKSIFSSIFTKVFLVFATIAISILTASFWLNRRSEEITRKQILELTWEQMQSNVEQFDRQITMLNNLGQYICSNNIDLLTLANVGEAIQAYERREAIQNLNEQLVQIQLGTWLVSDARIHLKKMERTVWSSVLSTDLDTAEYEYLMNTPFTSRNMTVYDGKLIMFYTSPANMNYKPGEKDSTFFMVIELSDDEVMKYMTRGDEAENSATVLLSEDGKYLLSTRDDAVTDHIVEQVMEQSDFVQDILSVEGTRYIIMRQESEETGLNLIKYIDFDANFSVFHLYRKWLIVFICLVLAAVVIFSLAVYRMVQKPINELSDAFRRVEAGDFNVTVQYKKNDEFHYLYHRFDRMVEHIKNLIEQVYEQKILSQRAELKQLQSQINPHFLYNSFFIISVMARKGDMEFVKNFTAQLGKYFRFLVKNDKEMIPLSEEIEYAQLYADIQMTRFSNRISITIEEVPKEFASCLVPRLIIQPLIENAIAYGLEKRKAGGRLRIYFKEEAEVFLIYVEDNGETLTEETLNAMRMKLQQNIKDVTMSGLFNIHRRLKIQYGESCGLELSQMPDGGLRVIAALRLKEEGGKGCV